MEMGGEGRVSSRLLLGYSTNFWILITTWVFFRFGFGISETYLANYVVALGASEAAIGLFTAISNASFALVQLPGGYVADTYGRKWVVVRMTWLIALNTALLALAPRWEVIPLIMLIDGFSRAYVPALRAMFMDSLESSKRKSGMMLSHIIPSIVAIPTPAIGGYIISTFRGDPTLGYRVNYLIAFAMALAAALLRTKLTETLPNAVKAPSIHAVVKESIKVSFTEVRSSVGRLPRQAKVLIALNTFLISTATFTYFPYLLRIAVRLGYSEYEWGIAVSSALALSIVAGLGVTTVVDRLAGSLTLAAGLLINTLALLTFPSTNVVMMTAALSLIYLSRNLAWAATGSLIADVTDIGARGTASALDNIGRSVGGVLGGVIASILFTVDPYLVLYVPSALYVVATVLVALVFKFRI